MFLGDNVYPEGMTPSNQQDARQRLVRQLAVVRNDEATALFVPENHDWAKGRVGGLKAVVEQEKFVAQYAEFLPGGGCPGPEYRDLPNDDTPIVRLVALDTQWWLHPESDRPTTCSTGSPAAVVAELTEVLKTSLPVVVVAHHPLATYGPHGGFFDWRDRLFPLTRLVTGLWIPLPVIGSLYPLIRWHLVRSEQDLIGSSNRAMRASLEKALASRTNGKSPLIYAAGHDHSLQIMRGTVADYLLVSGLGSKSKATAVGHGDDTVFAHEHPGFMALDFTDQGIWLSAIEPVASGEQVVLRVPVPSS